MIHVYNGRSHQTGHGTGSGKSRMRGLSNAISLVYEEQEQETDPGRTVFIAQCLSKHTSESVESILNRWGFVAPVPKRKRAA
jgi:hypothetical protein